MLPGGACDRQNVVQAHADVRHRDRPGCAREALGRCQTAVFVADNLGRPSALASVMQLAPHLPGYPEQQQAACQDQPDDLQQLRDDQREPNAENQRSGHTDDDDLAALLRREPCRQGADHDGVVAGQHEVDHKDAQEGG